MSCMEIEEGTTIIDILKNCEACHAKHENSKIKYCHFCSIYHKHLKNRVLASWTPTPVPTKYAGYMLDGDQF